jgi:HTH-type transcriptional regulator/antitoxin HigA
MEQKMIRPLRNEADYDAALAEIELYFKREPEIGTPEADRFDVLASLIEEYERKHWPIDLPLSRRQILNPHPEAAAKRPSKDED